MKILIVEDSMLYRKTIVKYLKEYLPDAEYITAVDGADGYRLYQQESPDFMVVDLLMPVMTGIQLLIKIRAENPELPAAVLTADVQKLTRQEVEKLGIANFISKPFTREKAAELAALISNREGNNA